MKPEYDTLQTRWTLVAAIKNPEDGKGWNEFYELYRGIILGVALKAGLREDEAKDVVQETMRAVAANIQKFEADPARGSFRAWLLNMARWRIKDQRDKRLPMEGSSVSMAQEGITATTPTIERVPDTREVDFAGLCDAECRSALYQLALKHLKLEVKAEHYQIFHLLEIDHKPIEQVARMVERSRTQIYLIKHRTMRRLKRIAMRLEKELN